MSKHRLILGSLLIAAIPALARAQLVGSEFQVNTYTTSYQYRLSVASDRAAAYLGHVVHGKSNGWVPLCLLMAVRKEGARETS